MDVHCTEAQSKAQKENKEKKKKKLPTFRRAIFFQMLILGTKVSEPALEIVERRAGSSGRLGDQSLLHIHEYPQGYIKVLVRMVPC